MLKGVCVDSFAQSGKTALHFLCMKNCSEGIELLLNHGADAFIEDNVSMFGISGGGYQFSR